MKVEVHGKHVIVKVQPGRQMFGSRPPKGLEHVIDPARRVQSYKYKITRSAAISTMQEGTRVSCLDVCMFIMHSAFTYRDATLGKRFRACYGAPTY